MMKISVFGGSQPKAGDTAYQAAYELGRQLALSRHTVLTGGYIGTMEAVSRGASDLGGHVIGVTCEEIENWRPVKPNQWVKEEQRKETLIERLQFLIRECDAAIALPGGPGTLAEITLMWNLMIVESLHRRPLVLVGNGWQSVFGQLYKKLGTYTAEKQRELVQFTNDIDTAVVIINS